MYMLHAGAWEKLMPKNLCLWLDYKVENMREKAVRRVWVPVRVWTAVMSRHRLGERESGSHPHPRARRGDPLRRTLLHLEKTGPHCPRRRSVAHP